MQPIFRLRKTTDISGVVLHRSLMLLVLFAAGCTKTVYVPVEKTTTVVKTERDTIVEVRLEKRSFTQRRGIQLSRPRRSMRRP